MTIEKKLKDELKSCTFDDSIMNDISSAFEENGYSLKSNNKCEVVIGSCKKSAGYDIMEKAINLSKKKIKYAFSLIMSKNDLYIRKKYKMVSY